MADNVTFQTNRAATPPNNTVVATDDVGGVAYQRIKLVHGEDGSVDGDVSDVLPLPTIARSRPYIKMEYSSNDLIYFGQNVTHNAGTDSATWDITKFTYSGGDIVQVEVLTGAWDDRATLSWA